MVISTLCLLHLKISPKMWPKPSAKSFGLKPSATEAKAEGQKTSASAEDLRPSVDPWYLAEVIHAANFLAFTHQFPYRLGFSKKYYPFWCIKRLQSCQPRNFLLNQNQAFYLVNGLTLVQKRLLWLETLEPLDAHGCLALFCDILTSH